MNVFNIKLGRLGAFSFLRSALAGFLALVTIVLAGCLGAEHAFQAPPIGRDTNYLLQKFGYPSEVRPSVMGAETWIYQTGGRSGSWEYTVKDGQIVNCKYISNR